MKELKELIIDKLHVRVFADREELGACAGREAADCIKDMLVNQPSVCVMFAAAPSQNETLAELAADEEIDWTRVHAFHMDEYIGIEEDHPASFRCFLKKAIFDKKPFASVNLINGSTENPEEEAARYEQLLKEHPLDVCILGVGENGHIAFNDPPVADFDDPKLVKVVTLEERCRLQQVHDGCFSELDKVPEKAITVTIPGLMAAKKLFCAVPSATKADAIKAMAQEEISTHCPATIMREHNHAELYLDADSGKYLLCEEISL